MNKPIGYWVKNLDQLIESRLDAVLYRHDLNRRKWQALNVVDAARTSQTDIARELQPFLETPEEAERLVDELLEGGWVSASDGVLQPTQIGRERMNLAAHDVTAERQRISEGISASDYETTVRTLSIMCRNLESGPA